jgi:hypothetical protein
VTTHSPIHFHLGQLFNGQLTGAPAGGPIDAKALVVEVSDDKHRGVLLLLPAGGRFDANRSFMPGWAASLEKGAWYLEKYAPGATAATWHVCLPDLAAVRAVVLDERSHGNLHKIRVLVPATAERKDVEAFESLVVERI